MHLIKRGETYNYNRELPGHAGRLFVIQSPPRQVGKNGKLRFSLGTGSKKDAERIARRIDVEIDDQLHQPADADQIIQRDTERVKAALIQS